MACNIDSFGREWIKGENELDKFIKKHNLSLEISYETHENVRMNDPNKVYFVVIVRKNPSGEILIEFSSEKPLGDDDILGRIKEFIREQKINKLLNGMGV